MKDRSKWWWVGADNGETKLMHLVRKSEWQIPPGKKADPRAVVPGRTACRRLTLQHIGVENPALILAQWADTRLCKECVALEQSLEAG